MFFVGCDLQARIPPLAWDSCGVCGGNNSCIDCFGVVNGTAKLDNCSVCNGDNACLGCDGSYNPLQKLVYLQYV